MNDKQSEIEETDVLKKQVEELTASLNEANRIKEKFHLTQFSIDKLSVPVFWIKKDASFFYVNDAACRSLGYTLEELLSLKVFDIDLKFQRENWGVQWQELKEKKTLIVESIHRTKEGVSFPVEITANYIDFNGEEYNCAFARNISQRKKTEKELKTAANILKNVSEAIIATDTNFTITGWNPGAEHMYEWKKEEVTGRKLKDILKIEYPKDSRDTIIDNFTNRGFYKGEVIHYKKDGTPMIVLSSISVIRDKKGNVIGAVSINSDITENKRVKKELKLSEERYKIAFQTSPDLININRMEDGKYININEGFTQVTGYTEEDVRDKTSLDINIWKNPEDREKVLSQLREKGVVKNFEGEFVMKDGSTRYGLMSAHVIDLGKEKQIISITHDITRQKLAEKALREREENYRMLFETNLAGVYKSTVKGKLLECNNAFVNIMGYSSKEEVLNISLKNLYHSEQERIKFINKLKESGSLFATDFLLKKKDGSDVWISENAVLIEDKFILGTLIDITDRKQYEKMLIESEAKFKDLTEKSLVGVYLIQNGLFSYVNPKLAEIFGYTVEELIDKLGPKDLTFPEDWHTADENIRKRIIGEIDSANYSFRGRKKDGSVIFVEVYGSRTIYKGTPAVVGTLIDITDRKQMEINLRESEARYRQLFEDSPAALWEEDFAELMIYLDELKKQGVSNLREYFDEHPEDVKLCAQKVKVLDVNNRAMSLHEAATKEELIGVLEKSLTEKELEVFKEEVISLAEGKNKFESGAEIITVQGTPKHIYLRLYVGQTQDGKNNYSRVLLAIDDITERKIAETKLIESLKSYQSIFNNASDAIYIQGRDGTFIDVNEGAVKMYGYPKEFFIGQTPEPLSAPGKNDLDRVANYVKKAFEGEPQQFEFWGRRSNGDIFPKIIRLQRGKYFGQDVVIAFAVDITESKLAEAAIREREENLSLIYDTVDDVIFQLSVEPDNAFRYLSVNKRFLELTGLSEEEVIGKRYDEVIPEPANQLVLDKYLEAIREKKTVHWEETSKYPTGKLTGLVSISPRFNINGECIYLVGSVHNITERKRAEIALRESEQLLKKSQQVAQLGSYVLDITNGIWTSSEILDEVFGIDKNYERTIDSWARLIHPEDRQRMITYFTDNVLTNHEPFNKEYRIINLSSGEVCWVHGLGELEFDSAGNPVKMIGTIQDITLRKKAEEEIRKLSHSVEQSPSIIIITDNEGNIEYVNPKFVEVTGYSVDEVKGKNPRILKSGETSEEEYRILWKTIKSGGVWRGVFHNRKKNGELYWERASISSIKNSTGTIINFIAVKEDITESKLAEEKLRKSEIRYRSVVGNATEGISITDEEGKLIEWNHALEKLTGIPSENVLGRYMWDVLLEFNAPGLENPSVREKINNEIFEFLKTGNAPFAGKTLENLFIKPDGTEVFIEQRLSSVKTDKGFMLLGTAVDITDRKFAEKALKESEEKFRSAFITSPDSININRLSDGLYVDINEGFTAITGYTREETIGKTSYEINVWADTKDRDRLVEGLKKNGRVENLEAKFRMKDGTIVTGLMSANILEINGTPHILSVTRNIEVLKKAQERIKESHIRLRNLAERLQMIREEERARVAREIHDDLGQTLTAIKMDASWLAKNSDISKEALSGKLAMMLELINSSIQSVKRIATELRPGLLDDLGLIAAIEWQAEEFQKRTNIQCDLKVDEKDIVLDDEISIAVFRIFQETLTNVTRHSGATKVYVSLNFTDEKLNMEIADNGVGITESQINSYNSLGLIGMRERVNILNGDLEITGERDKGTTVKFSIPLSKK